MSNVFLTSEDLMNAASQLAALQGEVMGVFGSMKGRMTTVSGIWQSPAADKLQQQFAVLAPSFDAFGQHLQAFHMFLDQTAQAYQENESMLSVSGV